jgi:hypothetical protein
MIFKANFIRMIKILIVISKVYRIIIKKYTKQVQSRITLRRNLKIFMYKNNQTIILISRKNLIKSMKLI